MTRKELFRIVLAMKMLSDFTAYWYLLPKRLKRIRTQEQLADHLAFKRMMVFFAEENAEIDRLALLINSGNAVPIWGK